jgi:hypothetical protein
VHIVVLAARTGWHTDELTRAAAERGHRLSVLPYEGLVARIGPASGLRSRGTELDSADVIP